MDVREKNRLVASDMLPDWGRRLNLQPSYVPLTRN